MTVATDGKGNYFTRTPQGEWVPTQIRKDENGAAEVRDGEEWKPLPAAKPAAPPPEDKYTIGNPMGDQGGAGGSSMPAAKPAAPSAQPEAAWPEPAYLRAGEGAGRIIDAAVEGYRNSPSLFTPEARKAVEDSGPIGKYIASPAAQIIGAGIGILGGASRGAQQTVNEVLSPIDPKLARDVAGAPEALGGHVVPGSINVARPHPEIPVRVNPLREAADRHTAQLEAPPPPPPVTLEAVTNATRRAGPEVWRPVQPGEEPQPGRSYRMNQETGGREVLEWGGETSRNAIEPTRNAIFPDPPPRVRDPDATITVRPEPEPSAPVVTQPTPWVSSTTADIQRVVQENAEAGGPASLGAAVTPQELAQMSPAQVKAHRRMSELNQIVNPIEGEDVTEWVRGSTPTQAERMGQPAISQKEIMTRQRNPNAFEGKDGQLTINDRARVRAVDETVLSDTQAADLKERQQKLAGEAQGRILSTAKPVDFTAAAAWIDAKLADPLIQEDKYVFNSLKGLRDQLYDADGNLKTDPRGAWGMHNNLRNKLTDAKDPLSANPSEKYAVTQVNEFKKLVDDALDKASGGQFRVHLDEQAEFLKSLNAWRLLNDFRYGPNKMINAKTGMINANAFHRFVTDLAIRRGRPGIDAAMDIPDEVFQRLINVDQDLKRAGRIDLGKPRGSSTNLFFELASSLGISGAHALTAAVTGGTPLAGIANVGVQTGISALQRRMGQRRLNRLTREAMEPPPGGLREPPGNSPAPP